MPISYCSSVVRALLMNKYAEWLKQGEIVKKKIIWTVSANVDIYYKMYRFVYQVPQSSLGTNILLVILKWIIIIPIIVYTIECISFLLLLPQCFSWSILQTSSGVQFV